MSLLKRITVALKPNIQLFDRNPKLETFGKLDKYPDSMIEEYMEDKQRRGQLGKQG